MTRTELGPEPDALVSNFSSSDGLNSKERSLTYPFQFTLWFQIDHTVGKNLHGWKNDIDNGARATEMCPDIKAIGIWLAAKENL